MCPGEGQNIGKYRFYFKQRKKEKKKELQKPTKEAKGNPKGTRKKIRDAEMLNCSSSSPPIKRYTTAGWI